MTDTTYKNWWSQENGFFGEEYYRQYEGTVLLEENTIREVDFLEQIFAENGLNNLSTVQVLDVPCGHGRHAIELAGRVHDQVGYDVTGYELSDFFLEKAKEKADARGAVVNWKQGDMRYLPFTEAFDAVVNMFTAMGYFDDDRQDELFFQGAYRALRTDGVFVVDYLNRDRLIRKFSASDWRELPDGAIVLSKRRYDMRSGQMYDTRITLENNQEVNRVDSSVRFYGAHELIAMAEKVGFVCRACYGGIDQQDLTMDSPRVILVFQKPS